jgi:hypothetical protein
VGWLLVLVCGVVAEDVIAFGAGRAGCAESAGGPRAGTMRPGGPLAGSVCGPLCDCIPVVAPIVRGTA